MESGRLEEEKLLVWNRLPGFNFVLVFFSILIIVIFCHLSLLCLKMALDGLKLVAAIKILQSRMLFEIRFCASFYLLNYITQGGHLNPDLKMVDEGLSVSLDWNLPSLQNITPSRTLSINFDPHGEIEEHDGDNDDHDEDREIIDLKLEKEALITESKNFWNQGDLRKRNY